MLSTIGVPVNPLECRSARGLSYGNDPQISNSSRIRHTEPNARSHFTSPHIHTPCQVVGEPLDHYDFYSNVNVQPISNNVPTTIDKAELYEGLDAVSATVYSKRNFSFGGSQSVESS